MEFQADERVGWKKQQIPPLVPLPFAQGEMLPLQPAEKDQMFHPSEANDFLVDILQAINL